MQAEIADQAANRLGGGYGLIQEAGRIAAHRKRPENLTAYEFYLLGTEKLEQITKPDIEEAVRLLNRAVELDPGLARAWVELYHPTTSWPVSALIPKSRKTRLPIQLNAPLDLIRATPRHTPSWAYFRDAGDFARAKAELDTALRLALG